LQRARCGRTRTGDCLRAVVPGLPSPASWRCARKALLAVDMAEVPPRRNAIAHDLLQLRDLGEAAVLAARPDAFAVHVDLEHARAGRAQLQSADFRLERREQLLRHPCRPQEPAALRAVADLDLVLH